MFYKAEAQTIAAPLSSKDDSTRRRYFVEIGKILWLLVGAGVLASLIAAAPKPVESPLVGWPTGGQMTQAFGCSDYYSGIAGPNCPAAAPWFHDGVDIGAPVGRPVRAAMAGNVIFAGPDGSGPVCNDGYRGYGLGVVIDNGEGWQTLYAHLSRLDVEAGQVVTAQTIIGAVGESGCATGPHLHFGLRHNGVLVDPVEYILANRESNE